MDPPLPNSLCSLLASGHLSRHSVESRASLLVLRHSDRPELPPKSSGTDLALSDVGKSRARHLGVRLRETGIAPGAVLMTSPMTRTTQTLLSICSGAGWNDRIESIRVSKKAFGTGTIYDDQYQASEVLTRLAISGLHYNHFVNEVGSGQIHLPGVKTHDQGAVAQMHFFKSILDEQKLQAAPMGLSIVSTHDINLVFLLAHYFDTKQFTSETWPPFLDSILIQANGPGDEDEKIRVIYGDKVIEVDLAENVRPSA